MSSFISFSPSDIQQLQPKVIITGAVALSLGLAWSNAITSLIDHYMPASVDNPKNVWYKLLFAAVLTFVVWFVATKYS